MAFWANPSPPWLGISLAGILVVNVFSLYLDTRQFKRFLQRGSQVKVPEELAQTVSQEQYAHAAHYQKDRIFFRIVTGVVDLVLTVGLLSQFAYPALWKYLAHYVAPSTGYGVVLPICFFMAVHLLEQIIYVPLELYSDFVIEAKHGFNRKTIRLFIVDKLKALAVGAAVMIPIMALWVMFMVVVGVMSFIVPTLIMPLFNKFEPLKDEELKTLLEQLAVRMRFPLQNIFETDGSKRSSHSNAFLFGFWKNKRIVLFDTLLKAPHAEIVAVMAHEIGHWKFSHFLKGVANAAVHAFLVLYICKLVIFQPEVYTAFGFPPQAGPGIGFFLCGLIVTPLHTLFGGWTTWLTRRHEYHADRLAAELGYSNELKSALIRLFQDNKGLEDPDPWYAWWNLDHPTVVERVKALNAHAKKD